MKRMKKINKKIINLMVLGSAFISGLSYHNPVYAAIDYSKLVPGYWVQRNRGDSPYDDHIETLQGQPELYNEIANLGMKICTASDVSGDNPKTYTYKLAYNPVTGKWMTLRIYNNNWVYVLSQGDIGMTQTDIKKLISDYDSNIKTSGNITTNGDAEFGGNAVVKGDFFVNNQTVRGNQEINGGQTVKGNQEVDGGQTVKGNQEVQGNQTVKGSQEIQKDLTVQGTSYLHDTNVNGDLVTTGNGAFGGNLVTVGNGVFGGNLSVQGTTDLHDTNVNGNLHVTGDTKVDGNLKAKTIEANDIVLGGQSTNERFAKVEDKVDQVGASAAALSALHPLEYNPEDKLEFSGAYGHYNGKSAGAMGMFYHPNEDTILSLKSTIGDGSPMVGVGFSIKFGPKGNSMSRSALQKRLSETEAQIKANNQVTAGLMDEISSLKARLNALTGLYDPNKLREMPDVPEDHWAKDAVEHLAGNGIIQGYDDGTFKGDVPTTRYESAEMLYHALDTADRTYKENEKKEDSAVSIMNTEGEASSVDVLPEEKKDVSAVESFPVDEVNEQNVPALEDLHEEVQEAVLPSDDVLTPAIAEASSDEVIEAEGEGVPIAAVDLSAAQTDRRSPVRTIRLPASATDARMAVIYGDMR